MAFGSPIFDQLGGCCLGGVRGEIGNYQMCAGLGHRLRNRATDTAGPAGHNCNFSFEH